MTNIPFSGIQNPAYRPAVYFFSYEHPDNYRESFEQLSFASNF